MLEGANKLKFQKFICLKNDFDKEMYKNKDFNIIMIKK